MHGTLKIGLAAGMTYFAAVFAAAFALGVVRTLWLEPALGAAAALAVELPIVLTLSWIVCRALVRRFRIGPSPASRLVMGMTAFALLMIFELLLVVLIFGRSPAQHLQSYGTWPGGMGLAAQVLFGLLPWLQPPFMGRVPS